MAVLDDRDLLAALLAVKNGFVRGGNLAEAGTRFHRAGSRPPLAFARKPRRVHGEPPA